MGNGQKAQMKREKNSKLNNGAGKSQLKSIRTKMQSQSFAKFAGQHSFAPQISRNYQITPRINTTNKSASALTDTNAK
ncbi:hypothetical protein O9G_002063 [Rozella allomycis CSF55]|uniref:Small EDRK-rich factor-like N-terminal domain-containing protein n=1 Tax=Rozella allomycis (strain CSF55) TaxID=988480 RepID=A0A075AW59_ROZAC|nr:hypothetical protein O9G_002063 [Rozella allomycis CSF55]|eukprot:EPZ34490.1 hypothetical protein O9G_002063 [Rozella allomycis CSF55]